MPTLMARLEAITYGDDEHDLQTEVPLNLNSLLKGVRFLSVVSGRDRA